MADEVARKNKVDSSRKSTVGGKADASRRRSTTVSAAMAMDTSEPPPLESFALAEGGGKGKATDMSNTDVLLEAAAKALQATDLNVTPPPSPPPQEADNNDEATNVDQARPAAWMSKKRSRGRDMEPKTMVECLSDWELSSKTELTSSGLLATSAGKIREVDRDAETEYAESSTRLGQVVNSEEEFDSEGLEEGAQTQSTDKGGTEEEIGTEGSDSDQSESESESESPETSKKSSDQSDTSGCWVVKRSRVAVDSRDEEERKKYREDLIAKYHAAMADREVKMKENLAIQHRIASHFRRKRVEERPDYHRNLFDQEQRYVRIMAQVDELSHDLESDRVSYQYQVGDLKENAQQGRREASQKHLQFMELLTNTANSAVFSRTGKTIPLQTVEQRIATDRKKDEEMTSLRLANIKLTNNIMKNEKKVKAKDQLAKGLHLIDFEQLKVENQTMNEKIEERNEELRKLRREIGSTAQMSTHLKEKMEFLAAENAIHRATLQEVESRVSKKRDTLTRAKKSRDSLKADNERLRKKSSMLCHKQLLVDFAERKEERTELAARLVRLKTRHTELTIKSHQVQKKIEWARRCESF